jgi:hypothetical protein
MAGVFFFYKTAVSYFKNLKNQLVNLSHHREQRDTGTYRTFQMRCFGK